MGQDNEGLSRNLSGYLGGVGKTKWQGEGGLKVKNQKWWQKREMETEKKLKEKKK